MPETLELPVPEKAVPEKVERFGQTVLSPEDVESLKGRVEATLGSDEPNSVYKAIDQLSHLKRAGVGGSVRLNREKLAQQREALQQDPQTLAKYLVRMRYLGLVDKKMVDEVSEAERTLIQEHINQRLAEKNTTNFAELCVSAKHLGIEIPQQALDTIRSETDDLVEASNNNVIRKTVVDTYVKRRAQARYLGIELTDDQNFEETTKWGLTEHANNKKWDKYARLQALYTRTTQQTLSFDASVRDSLVTHAQALKDDPAKIGRYLSDLAVIEKALPAGVPEERTVEAAETIESPVSGGDTVEEKITSVPETQESPGDIVKSRLEAPFFVTTQNGEVGCGTDEGFGYGGVNEDAVVVNAATNDFVVIDGMGGPGRGDEAAGILAESFKDGFAAGDSYATIQREAHERMQKEDLKESGAVLIAGRIRGEELQGTLVGDCRLVVIRNNEIVFATEDEGRPPPFHNEVGNPITGKDPGQMHGFTFKLQEGDRIVAGSDGLFESVAGYAETFNRNYWLELKKQFKDDDDIIAVADKALQGPSNKDEMKYYLDTNPYIYNRVRDLRLLNPEVDKLRYAGKVVATNQNAKLLSSIQGRDLAGALRALEEQTRQNMESKNGKQDNRSVFIYDVKHLAASLGSQVEPEGGQPEAPAATPAVSKAGLGSEPVEAPQTVPAVEPSLPVAEKGVVSLVEKVIGHVNPKTNEAHPRTVPASADELEWLDHADHLLTEVQAKLMENKAALTALRETDLAKNIGRFMEDYGKETTERGGTWSPAADSKAWSAEFELNYLREKPKVLKELLEFWKGSGVDVIQKTKQPISPVLPPSSEQSPPAAEPVRQPDKVSSETPAVLVGDGLPDVPELNEFRGQVEQMTEAEARQRAQTLLQELHAPGADTNAAWLVAVDGSHNKKFEDSVRLLTDFLRGPSNSLGVWSAIPGTIRRHLNQFNQDHKKRYQSVKISPERLRRMRQVHVLLKKLFPPNGLTKGKRPARP